MIDQAKMVVDRVNYESHTLYTNKDKDRPDVICDGNGQVCLDLCKICGAGEAELYERTCGDKK